MPYTTTTQVTNVTIASTTVPVTIIPVGMKNGWLIKNPAGSGGTVNVFPYTGIIPGSMTGINFVPLAPGELLNDNLFSAMSGADAGMGDGWGMVLQSAGSVAMVGVWR